MKPVRKCNLLAESVRVRLMAGLPLQRCVNGSDEMFVFAAKCRFVCPQQPLELKVGVESQVLSRTLRAPTGTKLRPALKAQPSCE